MKSQGKCKKNVLAIIDFQLSSNKERLWIIDFATLTTVHHTLVAHGQGTGQEFAQTFSNTPNSHQSSLGFYITESTYQGKHGLSLRLQGVEKGVNHNAYDRAIVMHGAKYVSQDFIKQHGRLGRSHGCPAVSQEEHQAIITTLQNKACLFIYYPDNNYHQTSELLQG